MRKLTLLIGLLIASAAHAQQYGSWSVDRLKDDTNTYYAASINEAGGLLGKVCNKSGCQWIVTASVNCESGAMYTGLLSSAIGAFPLNMQCSPNDKTTGRYVIKEFEVMESSVQKGEQVGIAMALKSGDFRVARYAIGGWAQASTQLAGRVSVMLRLPGEKTL